MTRSSTHSAARRTMSIRKTLGIALTAMTTVLMLNLAAMGLEIRNGMLENELDALRAQHAILAQGSAPALLFDDEQAAAQVLAALAASPNLTAARLLHADGRELANYGEPIAQVVDLPAERFVGHALISHQPIRFEGQTIGSLILVSSMDRFRASELRLFEIFGLLIIFAMAIALIVLEFLRRRIAIPLANFAETADEIARSGDYSQRVPTYASAELGAFSHGFNVMLEAVEQRDRELLNHKTRLEEMVATRTADLEEARDAAEAANRAKSAFLASMSHELRTPLNAVLGYAQLLLRDAQLDATRRQRIETIKRSGDYLLTLVNDVLDLAKIEAGRLELTPGPCNLARFFAELSDMFALRAAAKQIDFSYRPAAGLPSMVETDERRLRQICINLLGNAVRFTREGEVRLATDYRNRHLVIAVSDTGIGIPIERRREIFTPFGQVGEDRYKQQGTGLGLAICNNLVRQMGGQIALESQVGEGSRFTVRVPVSVITDTDALDEHGTGYARVNGYLRSDGGHGPFQLLVADDNEDNRNVLRGLLEPLGFSVSEARDGREALRVAAQRPFDLILMDLVMPGLDGLAATRELRALPAIAKTPIIAISARAFGEDRVNSLAAGCTAHLAKPVNHERLLGALGQYLPLEWQTAPPAQATPIDEDAVASLPQGYRARLKAAVLLGNSAQMNAVLEEIAAEHPAPSHYLEDLIAAYRYEEVIALLEHEAAPVGD